MLCRRSSKSGDSLAAHSLHKLPSASLRFPIRPISPPHMSQHFFSNSLSRKPMVRSLHLAVGFPVVTHVLTPPPAHLAPCGPKRPAAPRHMSHCSAPRPRPMRHACTACNSPTLSKPRTSQPTHCLRISAPHAPHKAIRASFVPPTPPTPCVSRRTRHLSALRMPPRRKNSKSLRYKFERRCGLDFTQIEHCVYLG